MSNSADVHDFLDSILSNKKQNQTVVTVLQSKNSQTLTGCDCFVPQKFFFEQQSNVLGRGDLATVASATAPFLVSHDRAIFLGVLLHSRCWYRAL